MWNKCSHKDGKMGKSCKMRIYWVVPSSTIGCFLLWAFRIIFTDIKLCGCVFLHACVYLFLAHTHTQMHLWGSECNECKVGRDILIWQTEVHLLSMLHTCEYPPVCVTFSFSCVCFTRATPQLGVQGLKLTTVKLQLPQGHRGELTFHTGLLTRWKMHPGAVMQCCCSVCFATSKHTPTRSYSPHVKYSSLVRWRKAFKFDAIITPRAPLLGSAFLMK